MATDDDTDPGTEPTEDQRILELHAQAEQQRGEVETAKQKLAVDTDAAKVASDLVVSDQASLETKVASLKETGTALVRLLIARYGLS